MGYSTYFDGNFKLNKEADEKLIAAFELAEENPEAFGVPTPSEGYCDWTLYKSDRTKGYDEFGHNYAEKTYGYVEWIEWIVKHILKPRGYIANGTIIWSGEESDDHGFITIKDNIVEWDYGVIVPQKWYNTAVLKVGDFNA